MGYNLRNQITNDGIRCENDMINRMDQFKQKSLSRIKDQKADEYHEYIKKIRNYKGKKKTKGVFRVFP